jgi:Protein of unknown function (DUF3768)
MTNQPSTGGAKKHASKQDKTTLIRELNDIFRTTLIGGRIILTEGISSLSPKDIDAVLQLVSKFDNFSEDNDPYGEHDFGSFKHNGKTIYFKIDYYAADSNLSWGSNDPSDPKVTERVLTIMFSHEY